MDLYYAMTNYQLLGCMLHRLLYNQERGATMLVSSFLTYHSPNLVKDLEDSGIFNKVLVYGETIFSHEENIKIEDEIRAISDKVRDRYGDLIDSSDNIYIGQDCDSLGVYLVATGRNYYFFEDASGTYSKPETLLQIIKRENHNRYEIIKKLKLCGRSEFVQGVYCDFQSQGDSFDSANCVDFSVKRLLKKLDERDLGRILRIYHCHKYDLGGQEKDLLLTWHYNNMGFMTLEEQREFFATLVDYFKDEAAALFIKPHPSDKQPNYEDWFRDAVVFERCMPSELLPFCVDGKFEKGITNWSTSVFGLKEILEDIVNFDKDIDETWRDFHKYFAISQYLNSNKKIFRQRIKTDNINQKQLLQLMKRYIKKYGRFYKIGEKGNIYIAKRYDEKYRGKKCIALTGEENSELKNVLKIRYNGKTDFVYLYNLDSNDIHVEKEMHYLGGRVIIDISSFNEDNKQQIMKR